MSTAARAAVAVAVTTIAVTGAWNGDRSGDATSARHHARRHLTLELTDPTFAIAPNSPWRSVYTVVGTIPDVIPPTTTTTTSTTTTTTTAPTTTARPRPGGANPRPGRTTSTSTAAAASTTTTVAPAPRVRANVRVVLYRSIDERSELAATLAGEPPNEIDTLELPADGALAVAGGATTLTVEAPTITEPHVLGALSMRLPGLYPIRVELRVDGRVVADHLTFVERLASNPPASSLNVAVLAAVDDPGPQPSSSQVADGRRDLAAIADVAAGAAGPVSVAIPPVLAAGLSADPQLAASLSRALEGAELLSLPAHELDPSSAVAIGESATFTRELREGEDVLASALPEAPTSRSAWVVTSPISAGAVAVLRNLGFRLLLLDDEMYKSLDGNIGGYQDPTLAAEADVGDGFMMSAVVVSPSGRFLDSEYLTSAGLTAKDAAVALLAELLTTKRELGGGRRGVILATPDVGVPDADVVAAFTSLATDVPDLKLVRLSAIAGAIGTMRANGGPVSLTLPAVAGPDLADRQARITLTQLSADAAASMMLDDTKAEAWREELDTLLSTGLDDATVDDALARISAEADAVRRSVKGPAPFTFTLTGRESVLRLNLRNDTDEPRRVLVRASSPKLTFPDGDQLVELAPSEITEVKLPVVARSNGTSSVEVELFTPTLGQTVDGPVVLTARVNALTGLGQVITGGAVLVLLSWWFSHFRRRRRERQGRGAPPRVTVPTQDVSPDAAEAIAGSRPPPTETSSVPNP
jgi:uncharacterized membrane protein